MATAKAVLKAKQPFETILRPPVISGANYSIKEAAHVLGVAPITIWRKIDSGELGHYRLGRRILVGGEHLLAYRQKNEQPAHRGAQ